jgi:hypothetical protein
MRNFGSLLIASLTVLNHSLSEAQESECKECRSVLQGGVFNTTNINKTQSSKRAFENWLCTTEFRTHDDAHAAGVSIGAVVYGIPIQVGGKYSDSQRDAWKKAHCQAASGTSDEFATPTHTRGRARVTPEILGGVGERLRGTAPLSEGA